jgi:hypothetical protein
MIRFSVRARRVARGATVAAAAWLLLGVLAGCAGWNMLESVVHSYGQWPAGRAPGTYAFERLPSQQARPDRQEMLEAAARPALEAAGFRPAAAGATPDVTVQLGGRVTRTEYAPWDDPLWWRGGFGVWRHRPWSSPYWGVGVYGESPRYEREVAMLIRDRASGEPLYETRASNDGLTRGDAAIVRAMYAAALKDFPATGVQPRTVTTPLAP